MFNKKINRTSIKKIYKSKYTIVGLILFVIVLLAACSPNAGSGFLKFMFDGVPDKPVKESVTDSALSVVDSSNTNLLVKVESSASGLFYHTPYKDRACTKCHSTEAPGKIIYAQDEYCYSCHEDFQKKYSILHGPVAGGFCTACHAPHFSDNKKLLIRKGQDICLLCHAKELIMQNEVHTDIGNTICTECHNPHGGSDRYLSN